MNCYDVGYDYIIVDCDSLDEEIRVLNLRQNKIVSVTQHGNRYTIFFETNGFCSYGERKDDAET